MPAHTEVGDRRFLRLYMHIARYQQGYLSPEEALTVAASIRTHGLRRSPHNPVLARRVEDALRFGRVVSNHPELKNVLVFTDYPAEHTVGIDVSLGDFVPPERLLAVVIPEPGETVYDAFLRGEHLRNPYSGDD